MFSEPADNAGVLRLRVQIREITFSRALVLTRGFVLDDQTAGQGFLHDGVVHNEGGQALEHLGQPLYSEAGLGDEDEVVEDAGAVEGPRHPHRHGQAAGRGVGLGVADDEAADRALGDDLDGQLPLHGGLVPGRRLRQAVHEGQVDEPLGLGRLVDVVEGLNLGGVLGAVGVGVLDGLLLALVAGDVDVAQAQVVDDGGEGGLGAELVVPQLVVQDQATLNLKLREKLMSKRIEKIF